MGDGWIDAHGTREVLKIFRDVDQVLGFFDFSKGKGYHLDGVAGLLAERMEAREKGEWERSDALRFRLEALGVTVRDTPVKVAKPL